MIHPFQCIATAKPSSAPTESNGYLLAACGLILLSVCLASGEIVTELVLDAGGKASAAVATNADGKEDEKRPTKKQKIAPSPTSSPNVIKLAVSPDSNHAVVVSDDKCVHVFKIQGDGKLQELSQRYMPKRPCAVQVLPDKATILCADKFGDVYSLPLIPKGEDAEKDAVSGASKSQLPHDSTKMFKPSATNLTVHTQRNRKALEAQQKQKELTPKTKEPLKFEHKLLLGHVSMLTDLIYAIREVDGKQRGYIITADRDEHIRVSRGPPQSHVIEGYCLGHKQFVSKVCVVPGTDLLVSGGGDDWLGVWDWPTFELRWKIKMLHPATNRLMRLISDGAPMDTEVDTSFAISGLRVAPAYIAGERVDVVVLAHEGESALMYFPVPKLLEPGGAWPYDSDLGSGSPVLDIACAGDLMLVSFDARRVGEKRVRAYRLQGPDQSRVFAKLDEDMDIRLQRLNSVSAVVASEKGLSDLLYGVKNLRKRAHYEDGGEGDSKVDGEE